MTNRKTVLLVEDEMFVALDIQMALEDEGWAVAGPFARASEAVQYLQGHEVDCAVLDVRLLDGDVFPVADKLANSGIPFLFHSGHADPEKLERSYPSAAVCQKPCHPASLVAKIIEFDVSRLRRTA
jgi:DNA-binding response OmpR family regulator